MQSTMRISPAPSPAWRRLSAVLLAVVLGLGVSVVPDLWSAESPGSPRFRFSPIDDNSLLLWDGNDRVLVYNHGMLLPDGVPADRRRSSYVHPIYGLDGEVLTDDFPEDHYHHRGLFWAWPHVRIAGQHYDLWAIQGIRQRFERWLARDVGATEATLAVENGWYVGEQKVVQERIRLRVHPVAGDARCIDVDCDWVPVDEPLTLAGAEGKSYGGLTLRYAPRTDTVITTPLGKGSEDLSMTPLAWADLSARFAGRTDFSGIALFVADDHPDYPPTWLTRHYGALCIGWPGVEAQTFPVGRAIHCRYRVWVHRGAPSQETIQHAYEEYRGGMVVKWSGD
ncbi:MAG: PmoA family protein [Verrucomicrobiales bacterium]|nr:PmoA family protein [Verrucomicrobiales bacterium]